MRRVLTHSVYALVLLAGSMGASPGHITIIPPSTPAFLPLPPQTPKALRPSAKPYQVGKASWYGGFFQGRATASGENYDMYDFTAAHRELPLGTIVKVTNLSNRKSVIVRVNDRGPATPGRIIDLSFSAARSLGMHQNGLQRVSIDILGAPEAEMAMAKQPAAPR
jgi:rare lipoprotein A